MCMWYFLPVKQFIFIWLYLFVFIVIGIFILDPLTLWLSLFGFCIVCLLCGSGWGEGHETVQEWILYYNLLYLSSKLVYHFLIFFFWTEIRCQIMSKWQTINAFFKKKLYVIQNLGNLLKQMLILQFLMSVPPNVQEFNLKG